MSSNRNTVVRTLHDLGAAAWFGGSLMGAVALNGASDEIREPSERARVAAKGWARWTPVSAGAIGAHLIGGVGLLVANQDRVQKQAGVRSNSALKSLLTVAAMGTTAYSGVLGAKLAENSDQPVESGTVPAQSTRDDVARTQQQLRVLQWATPVLTGVLIVLGAQQGEQQKSGQVLAGKAAHASRRLRD
jgi:hypothetical protein